MHVTDSTLFSTLAHLITPVYVLLMLFVQPLRARARVARVYVRVQLLNQPADTRSVQFRYQAPKALLNLKFSCFFKVYTDISAHIYTLTLLLHVHIACVCFSCRLS